MSLSNHPNTLGGGLPGTTTSGGSPVGTLGITDDQVAVGATAPNTIEGSANFTFGLTNGLRLSSSVTGGAQLYNTADQTTNYERGELLWTSNQFRIRTVAGGSGTVRSLFLASGSTVLEVQVAGGSVTSQAGVRIQNAAAYSNTSGTVSTVQILSAYNQASGTAANTDLLINRTETAVGSGTQNYIDCQTAGASKFSVSNVGAVLIGTNATGTTYGFHSRSKIGSAADGTIVLFNNAATDFTRLQFGGTTSSFPALKRSSATLEIRLADDSAYAALGCSSITATSTMTALSASAIPAGGTTGAGYRFSSTANFGVFFGSGAPTLSAAQGSLYLRSDGSSTSTRAYINTDGGTTWTAITTAA